ncbi:MAG: efflux RND transporter periplasmic adaptor subunit [Bryobacteraceae bacterium]
MRYSESDRPGRQMDVAETAEEQLRRENRELRRQLEDLRGGSHGLPHSPPAVHWRPSGLTVAALCLIVVVIGVIAFFAGYLPLRERRAVLMSEARDHEQVLPRVEVITVRRSPSKSGLVLPGNIQATAEAPILARADGYVQHRLVDIGDRVQAGQLLAQIEAPELDEQVRQAEATVQQARAGLEQAAANLQQGKSELELARVMSQRWANLITSGSVSEQENDQMQAQYRSKQAGVEALEKAVSVQRSGIAAAEANVARLEKMRSYRRVTAPFDGVITLRNVDDGALVNSGTTLLFRIAQTAMLRTYVNVPQNNASSVHPGESAIVTVSNLPGRQFPGTVARSSNALDPASRTLLVEVHVPNPSGALMPGMYAQVELTSSRKDPPLLIPSDALIMRSDGAQVAVVRKDHRVHVQKVDAGRDYGDRLEVLTGLEEGDIIIANPGDVVSEGTEVDPVPADRSDAKNSPR